MSRLKGVDLALARHWHLRSSRSRARGYRSILLDTLASMTEAQALYRRLGFVDIPAYYDTPIADTIFMRKDLAQDS